MQTITIKEYERAKRFLEKNDKYSDAIYNKYHQPSLDCYDIGLPEVKSLESSYIQFKKIEWQDGYVDYRILNPVQGLKFEEPISILRNRFDINLLDSYENIIDNLSHLLDRLFGSILTCPDIKNEPRHTVVLFDPHESNFILPMRRYVQIISSAEPLSTDHLLAGEILFNKTVTKDMFLYQCEHRKGYASNLNYFKAIDNIRNLLINRLRQLLPVIDRQKPKMSLSWVIKVILEEEFDTGKYNEEQQAEILIVMMREQLVKIDFSEFSKDEELIKGFIEAPPERMRAYRKIQLIKHFLKIK